MSHSPHPDAEPAEASAPQGAKERAHTAKQAYAYAFQLLDLLVDTAKNKHKCPMPGCHNTSPNAKLFGGDDGSPGWSCMKCRAHNTHRVCPQCRTLYRKDADGDVQMTCTGRPGSEHDEVTTEQLHAVGLLILFAGATYGQAIKWLHGEPTPDFDPPEQVDVVVSSGSAAVTPESVIEVFEGIFDADGVSVERAQQFYGRFGIAEHVVARARFVGIDDIDAFKRSMMERFGPQRLVDAGIVKDYGENLPEWRRYFWLVSDRHPIIEMQSSAGRPRTLQFRASETLEAEIAQTKARIEAEEGRKAKYSETPPKTMSLIGIGEQPGFGEAGLEWLATHYPGATVALVEGGKDYLAGRTLGLPVCAVAGTGSMLSDRAMNALRYLKVVMCFDGDEAGQTIGYQRADDFRRASIDVAGVHRSSCLAATFAHDDRIVNLGTHVERHCRCFVRDGNGRPTDVAADPDGLDLTDCLTLLVQAGRIDAPATFDTDKAEALAS